jgi:DNA primase
MDSQVEEVKARIDIAEVVGQYVTLKRAGKNLSGRCPFHTERTPSFYVSPERGTFMCFGCGEKGDALTFLQKIEGIDFPTALKQLAEKAGVKLKPRFGDNLQSKEEKNKQEEKAERLRTVCEAATSFFESILKKRQDVQSYLRERGVKDETIRVWRLGYAPASWRELSAHLASAGFSQDEMIEAGLAVKSDKRPNEVFDRFRGRIMFPIFDSGGQAIAFSGRFFEDVPSARNATVAAAGETERSEPAKYVNSPETLLFKKSRTLYGFDKAKAAIRKADCVLLVEGQFDLVLAHQSGLPFTVALSGTALTPEHLVMLGRLSKRLVLALDNDAAGIRAGLKSTALAYAAGFDVKIAALPQGKDPADLARENPELLKQAIRTSQTAVEFFLDALRLGARDDRAYTKAVEVQVLPLVAALSSKLEQAHFVEILVRRLRAPESAVWAQLAKQPTPSGYVPTTAPEPGVMPEPTSTTPLSVFKRRVGMLLFAFPDDVEMKKKIEAILGLEKLTQLELELAPHAEELRYRFEAEVGEHSTPEVIAADILAALADEIGRERFKMRFL